MRLVIGSATLVMLGALANCVGGSDATPVTPGDDAGQSPDGSGACIVKTCADTEQCGTYDDGCGGTIQCEGSCSCDESNFETVCPQRPCEVVSGCQASKCVYSAITCGNARCLPTTCEGEGCGNVATAAGQNDKLYSCGDAVCNGIAQYCDPTTTVTDGKVGFQNRCVAPTQQSCGACGLGTASCNTSTDRFDCRDVPVPNTSAGGTLECDDTVTGSTFVFFDAEYTGSAQADGTRQRPFTTLDEAMAAAQSRNARGVIIAGSPVFSTPLVVRNGVSLFGGFESYPDFAANPAQRPRWNIPASAVSNGRLLGGSAKDIVSTSSNPITTALYHLEIRTADLSVTQGIHGASNIGFWAENAPALSIIDVDIHAGAGAAGAEGANGTVVAEANRNGGHASGRAPGAAGLACATVCNAPLPEHYAAPNPNGTACGAGGVSREEETYDDLRHHALAGNAGSSDAGPAGGQGGVLGIVNGCGYSNEMTEGSPGATGRSGVVANPNGAGAVLAALNADGTVNLAGAAQPGAAGQRGGWGSGGGAGGAGQHTCRNEPELGGEGGGGGGPGCGGDFGRAGGNGGVSIGLGLVSSAGIDIQGGKVTASNAGTGGRGGNGQPGGMGGSGESNAATLCRKPNGYPINSYSGQCGGHGGDGGRGGHGGHGGGGAGGSSIGVYCASSGEPALPTTITVGSAGAAGASPGNAGAAGESLEQKGCR